MGRILDQQPRESKETEEQKSIPFWRVVISVIQASFGVQNPNNRERDFKHGRALPFVVAALLFTVAFVLVLAFIVTIVVG